MPRNHSPAPSSLSSSSGSSLRSSSSRGIRSSLTSHSSGSSSSSSSSSSEHRTEVITEKVHLPNRHRRSRALNFVMYAALSNPSEVKHLRREHITTIDDASQSTSNHNDSHDAVRERTSTRMFFVKGSGYDADGHRHSSSSSAPGRSKHTTSSSSRGKTNSHFLGRRPRDSAAEYGPLPNNATQRPSRGAGASAGDGQYHPMRTFSGAQQQYFARVPRTGIPVGGQGLRGPHMGMAGMAGSQRMAGMAPSTESSD